MFKLACRSIFRQRTRTILTLAAIALGVASLVISGGFVEDTLIQLREATIRSQLGHLQVYRQGRFASGGHHPADFLIGEPEVIERALNGVAGVVARARRISFSGLLNNGRGELPIIGQGVEPKREALIGSAISILSGRQLADTDLFGIMVGEGLANALALRTGDKVNLVLSTREGATNTLEFDVIGIFRSLSKEFDARAVQIPLPAAHELMATTSVDAIVVLLSDAELTPAVRAELKERLPPDFEVKTWQELADFYNNTAALYQRQFGFLRAIILVMMLLTVANSLNMSLYERTAEFGIMRALGQSGGNVGRLVVLETALLGVIGSALGIMVGALMAVGVSAIGIPMPPPPNSESGFVAGIRVVPSILVVAFLSGLLASIGAGLLPARRVARMPLVEALRYGA